MPKLGIRRKKSSPNLAGAARQRPASAPKTHAPASDQPLFSAPASAPAHETSSTAPLFSAFKGFSGQPSDTDATSLLPPKESPGSSSRSSPERRSDGSALIDMTPPVAADSSPLIPKPGTRARRKNTARYVPDEWDDCLPYGGKVYLARKKKPDTWLCFALQILLIGFAVGLVYYSWYHTDHMHFHATKLYGHYGHMQAQAMTAEKYLHGKGVARNHSEAMAWFKRAADQGHPHSSYNLAVGHLQGLDVGLESGQAHALIRHAAEHGVPEAVEVLDKVCARSSRCD